MPNGVIFDMDGVLVDSGPAHHQSWQRLAAKHDIEVPAERFQQTFGRPSRDIIRLLWGERVSDAEIQQLDEEKESLYRELISERIPLMPGCRKTLERLQKANLALAVATSGPPENLELVLSEGLIANYFDATVDGFEIAAGKPAPDCFLLAADRLELPPASCLVVEDAPVGIQAATAAGIKAIGLVGTHPAETLKSAGAVQVVQRLDEITPALVAQLATAP
jgi:beta-phosphoglucomutase